MAMTRGLQRRNGTLVVERLNGSGHREKDPAACEKPKTDYQLLRSKLDRLRNSLPMCPRRTAGCGCSRTWPAEQRAVRGVCPGAFRPARFSRRGPGYLAHTRR